MSSKISQLIAVLGVLTLFTPSITSFAQSSLKDDSINAIKESQECAAEYPLFLSSLVESNAIIEYWNDLFRNLCHLDDINSVLDEITYLQKSLRSAFYKCDKSKIEEYKLKYITKNAELYYLRKFIDTRNNEIIEVSPPSLLEDMKKWLFQDKNILTEKKVIDLFYEFKTKYQDRLSKYQVCTSGSLNRLKESWRNLTETFDTAGNEWEEKKKRTADRKTQKEVAKKEQEKIEAKDGAKGGIAGFLEKRLGFYLNGTDPKKSLQNIKEELTVITGQGPTTVAGLQQAAEFEDKRINLEKEKATLKAYYEVLYGEAGDAAAKNLEDQLIQTNKTIKATYPALNRLLECSKIPYNRQCK